MENKFNVGCSLYRYFDKNKNLLYVGISTSAIGRMLQHKQYSFWFKSISRMTVENFNSREDAVVAEREAIKKEKPLHNKSHSLLPKIKKIKKPEEAIMTAEDIADEKTIQADLEYISHQWTALGWEEISHNVFQHKTTGEVIYHKTYQQLKTLEI